MTVSGNVRGRGDFGFGAETSRGRAELATESTIKGGLGCVTHLESDVRNAVTSGGEQLRSKLHAPAGEVSHGRDAEEMAETLGEDGTGEVHLGGQGRDGPWIGGLTMVETDGFAVVGNASTCEPS